MLLVVDQNYFRSGELRTLVASDAHVRFVVPDVALLEMCKGPAWRETMQRSLDALSSVPSRVLHSISVGEAIATELETKRSIDGRLLPREFRDFTRGLLRDIAAGGTGKTIDLIASRINNAQSSLNDQELNHSANQSSLVQRTDIIRSVLSAGILKQLRSGKITDADRLTFVTEVSRDLCASFLTGAGWSSNKVKLFLHSKPLLLRYIWLSVRHCVDWAQRGGIEGMLAERVTNDLLDQEYALIASFFDGLLSKEARVMNAYEELRQCVAIL